MKSREILVKHCFSKAHLKTVRRVVKADPRILLEEDLRFQTRAAAAPGVIFVRGGKYFPRYAKSWASVSSELRTVRRWKLTVKRRAAAWDGEGGQRGDAGGNLPLRQHCESTHLAESGSCGYRPSDADRGWKGEGKRAQSGESLWGIGCRAGERREVREERGAQGEVHGGLDAEISVTYSSCEGFSNEKRCETNRNKICDYFDLLR